jgi:DNA replication protein DnaC
LIGTCDECHGSGVVLEERMSGADVYGVDKPLIYTKPCPMCRGGHVIKVDKVRQRANIPPSFFDSYMEDFKWDIYLNEKGQVIDLSQQKKFIESFINDYEKWSAEGLGLYLWSNIRGTGKTFLASCICNELMKQKALVSKFVSASELIKMDSEDKKTNFEKSQIDVLCDCTLLVIDDLGQQKSAENWLDDILFRIIDARYQNKRVTIITSNIELQKLRLDDRVSDRLNKMCQTIPLPDFSYRQKESKKKKVDFFKEMGLM